MENLIDVIETYRDTDCEIRHLVWREADMKLVFYRSRQPLVTPEAMAYDVEYSDALALSNEYGLSLEKELM